MTDNYVKVKGRVKYADDHNIEVQYMSKGHQLKLTLAMAFGGLDKFHNKDVWVTISED